MASGYRCTGVVWIFQKTILTAGNSRILNWGEPMAEPLLSVKDHGKAESGKLGRTNGRTIAATAYRRETHRQRDTFQFLTRFGSDLLSHALRRSTIGAAVLNCRVRDGIGCFTCAMTTKPRKEPTSVSLAPVSPRT